MRIERCLVDTNILLRATRRSDPQHELVSNALAQLADERCVLHFTFQNIAELWNVMTRPQARNGFGMSASDVEHHVAVIEAGMTLLPDSIIVYREWRSLVRSYGVSGTRVHDARLVASMLVHGVTHILTLNAADFTRFRGITAVNPAELNEISAGR